MVDDEQLTSVHGVWGRHPRRAMPTQDLDDPRFGHPPPEIGHPTQHLDIHQPAAGRALQELDTHQIVQKSDTHRLKPIATDLSRCPLLMAVQFRLWPVLILLGVQVSARPGFGAVDGCPIRVDFGLVGVQVLGGSVAAALTCSRRAGNTSRRCIRSSISFGAGGGASPDGEGAGPARARQPNRAIQRTHLRATVRRWVFCCSRPGPRDSRASDEEPR